MLANIGVLLIILVVAGIFFGGWLSQHVARNQAKVAAAEAAIPERFGSGDYHFELPGPRCIGIAWDAERLVLGDDPATIIALPFDTVRAVEVEIDGVEVTTSRSTTRTNRGSQAIGGAIGGLALGPAGLLLGGLSGSNTTVGKAVAARKIKSIKLTVRIADRAAPLRTFTFFDAGHGEGFEATGMLVKPKLEKAAHYHALLTQIIEDRIAGANGAAVAAVQA